MIERAPRGPEEMRAAAEALGCRMKDFLVLSRSVEPFMTGSETDRRDAEWFTGLWQRFGYTTGVHLRRIHYRVLSERLTGADGQPYENTERCWKRMTSAAGKARDLGLIDPLAFDDRRNELPILNTIPRIYPAAPTPEWTWEQPEQWEVPTYTWRVPSLLVWLPKQTIDFGHVHLDENGAYAYERGDDPTLIEVWIEKTTMDDVLKPLCRRLGVNLVRGAGFLSETRIMGMLDRARRHNKPVRIFYISDFDPAGSFMHTAVARNVEYYRDLIAPGSDIALEKIALTRDQVAAHSLPRVPIKEEDCRKANFEKINGTGAVELDALEALRPGELARIVTDTINPYIDHTLPDRLGRTERTAEISVQEAFRHASHDLRNESQQVAADIQAVTNQYYERLNAIKAEMDRLLAPYQEHLDTLADDMARDLAPHQQQLEHLRAELDTTMADLQIDLPERPDGQCDGSDETDWLYRSDRHWRDQLARFHTEKSGGGAQ